ncbi:CHAT domain-containing protein [Thermocoleostomius sinensis]|uniref:CHAT domain-containing protein n=1 Tax=Thermocoleostomius sinensis A174 TaxID=2016057 RepID=A0A9E8ZJN0_9CYAN|nr:CHAT domain-containing protein [Thermocoleostomius sinensis]WAL62415.1 CHAT domain-containing protein [Thermocoleostomius sinensis A174]
MKYYRQFKFILIFFFAIGLGFIIPMNASQGIDRGLTAKTSLSQLQTQTLEQQAQQFYEQGQYQQAIDRLQQAIAGYENQPLRQAAAYSNLALAHQQLGNWAEANQAIYTSLNLLQAIEAVDPIVLAQVLNIQGGLQLAQGQPQAAIASWQQATTLFEQANFAQANQVEAIAQMHIHQAHALQTMGLYRQAISQLSALNQRLQTESDSVVKATALRSLGDALIVAGNLPQAEATLNQSLQIATQLPDSSETQDAIAAIYLSLGNLTRAQAFADLGRQNLTPTEAIIRLTQSPSERFDAAERAIWQQQTAAAQTFYQQTQVALDRYEQAAATAISQDTQLQSQLNQLSVFIATDRLSPALTLYPQIQTRLDALPPTRRSIYQRLDLAQNLAEIRRQRLSHPIVGDQNSNAIPSITEIAQQFTTAQQYAQSIGDVRSQSFSLGGLGELYEQTGQWQVAQSLTEQALELSQSIDATDISYRWQWQLGRLLNAQGAREAAIFAYQEAVNSLQSLRNDLVAVNRDVQFSFREQIEPVYRELVGLLLHSDQRSESNLERLIQARDVIEGLQIAELDNFFREACLDTKFQLDRIVDQEQVSAAILYTILLPNYLDVIVKLPHQSLLHVTTEVAQQTVESTIDQLLVELKRPFVSRRSMDLSAQIYDWLLRPVEATLQNSNVETLVFVLDGSLRSLPMATLYDGQQYLLQKYSVAIAPGLQLPDPQPLQAQALHALVVGLSEARENFPPLNYVVKEIEQIQADIPSQVLFNQSFTRDNFQATMRSQPFTIVHIATHGQFSSNAAGTFILAWDEPIDVNELSTVLQTQELVRPDPIELLVLSACQTAVGDRRATLGLAGVSVRAGARSTIASLWNLDDDSGAVFMGKFYQELLNSVSKAEALRRAQLSLLTDPTYQSPRFWGPYVLLGNWL